MELTIKGKNYNLPIFLPDATHGVIKSVDSIKLADTGTRGIVTNAYHLLADDAVDTIKQAGGIKKFMMFEGLVITDSGGFQAMSLVRRRKNNGKITDDGIWFKNHRNGASILLSPENCIETQLKIGSDIVMVLDDCTDPVESLREQEKSVERTIRWAARCKKKFEELVSDIDPAERPLIFGIIQGGNSKDLRQKCSEELQKINFDGYAYGGWPVMNMQLLTEILKFTADTMPANKPKYAMGVGKPSDISICFDLGYNMFDCVIPTRDARHNRLYTLLPNGSYSTINIKNLHFEKDFEPIENTCPCYTCKSYSKAYLRHLFKANEQVAYQLATIHNLTFYARWTDNLGPKND